ncbi:uncharacterized protein LOC123686692 [Harmonia axyridis]|uniref:uncharacterized protein LOC123686692 n=1 Tax=Harmonia axyridis TaxID=115357 RepID=UPI001E2760CC|nr:uncharacterized protein LOC123686692 [Harmonia axyridis]
MSDAEEEVLLLSLLYFRCKKRRKRRQRIWIHPIIEEREKKGQFRNLFAELKNHEDKFFNFTRMSTSSFEELLNIIKENLKKNDTIMRKCISPEEKLVITLRFLASGCSLTDI